MFVTMRVRGGLTFHGFDSDNREIVFDDPPSDFAEKVIAVSRIQSATERYLLVTGPMGRMMYWEYEGGLAKLKPLLAKAGLLIGE
jgi:hypothetical protein